MRRPTHLLLPLVLASLAGCWATHVHDGTPADPGYPDADLPLFAPASQGMTWTSRTYDMAGQGVGNEIEEMDTFDNATDPKTRHLRVVEDVKGGSSQFSSVDESVYADRIEAVTEENSRVKVLLRTPLAPGTTWTYKRGSDAGVERRTIAAIEDVCTPWGYFPRAIKVLGTILGPRPGAEEALRTRTEEWWVRGVGRVQVIARVDGKPELDIRSVVEGFIDPQAAEPFTPRPCPS